MELIKKRKVSVFRKLLNDNNLAAKTTKIMAKRKSIRGLNKAEQKYATGLDS